jgi:hypothetical protein
MSGSRKNDAPSWKGLAARTGAVGPAQFQRIKPGSNGVARSLPPGTTRIA